MKIFANENLFDPIIEIYKRPVDETLTIFKKYYQTIKTADVKGNLIIITPEGVRIRRSTR